MWGEPGPALRQSLIYSRSRLPVVLVGGLVVFVPADEGRRAAVPQGTRACVLTYPGARSAGAGTGQLGPRCLPAAQWTGESSGEEGRCDGSVWFTSLARPSLLPSFTARGGAAVREGPAGRQLLPASGGGLCDKAAGWRSSLSPHRYVRGGSLVLLRGRAEPALPGRKCGFGAGQLLPGDRRRSPAGSTLPAGAGRFACPQPRFLTLRWLEVGIASPAANKSSAPSTAPASWPREHGSRQPGASPGEAGREAGTRRERGRAERGLQPYKAAGAVERVRVRFANRK